MEKQKSGTIRLNPDDNVVVALGPFNPDTTVKHENMVVCDSIPAGHKIATSAIPRGGFIHKYGQIIGVASQNILPGEHVHSHNVDMSEFQRDYDGVMDMSAPDYIAKSAQATFDGIVRADDSVATRNYIGVLPTVGCSASICRYIADYFGEDILKAYPNVDGVVGLTQNSGCGMGGSGKGFEIIQRSLAGYAKHPNFWGVLFVGLGCEVNQAGLLFENTGLADSLQLRTLTIQNAGGTKPTVDRGIAIINEMLPEANQAERQPVSASHLKVGLECGGSDAYSGITVNPALGAAADLVVRNGGTAILSETPEIYGAEHLLIQRAANQGVRRKIIDLIHWWEDYATRNGARIDNNPSPGNKAGGLTTILEKSLGAVAKGGTTALMEVYQYAEPVYTKGLVFMDTPGYDLASITGMIAGGANVICFTTGCGTVLGCKPTPVIKLASNSTMYARLSGDMDINCGTIAEAETTVAEMGAVIFERILETASGKKTKSENYGFGDNEFVPWQMGAVL